MMIATEEEARAFVAQRADAAGMARLDKFVARLQVANTTQNLVSKASMEHVWQRHIADSAQLLDHVPRETSPWMDFGSGAGLPGLVVAAIDPSRKTFLIESRKLRIEWLTEMIGQLQLTNCRVLGGDATRVDCIPAAVISARAFAPMDRLVALSARFSTSSTRWVLPKGRSAAQEVAALPESLRGMFHVEQSVTDAEAGIVVGTGAVETAQ